MNNPRLANRYAKSLLDLASEQNSLDVVWNDVKYLTEACNGNPGFCTDAQKPGFLLLIKN